MTLSSIHVGCGEYSLQRLKILIEGEQFTPVACVDIDLKKAKSKLSSLKDKKASALSNSVYTTIKEAQERHKAKVCFIFVSSDEHAKLVIESLKLGLHTFCVKSIASNQKEFKNIIKTSNARPELMLVQGFNNQWNEAALKMREWIQKENGIGKMLGGECICWGRQNMKKNPPQVSALAELTNEGMFFYTLACHQLSQLVMAKGLPDYVTAYVHSRVDNQLDYRGVWGTTGGQCLLSTQKRCLFHILAQELLMEILSVLLLDGVANGLFMVKKVILEEKVVV